MAKPSATDMIVLEGGDSVTEENKYCGESGKVDNIIWLTFTMCNCVQRELHLKKMNETRSECSIEPQ